MGPTPLSSTSGAKYYVIFVDAYSKYTWLYLLSHKSQALEAFFQFKTMAELQLNTKLKALQTDNAKEFLAFTKHLQPLGIHHRLSCPHAHE